MSKPIPHSEELRSSKARARRVPTAASILEAGRPVPFLSILFDQSEISTVVDGRENAHFSAT